MRCAIAKRSVPTSTIPDSRPASESLLMLEGIHNPVATLECSDRVREFGLEGVSSLFVGENSQP